MTTSWKVFIGVTAVFGATLACVEFSHVEARLAKLEAAASGPRPVHSSFPSAEFRNRFKRLEDRVSTVERIIDEQVVRQGLAPALKNPRDLPSGAQGGW